MDREAFYALLEEKFVAYRDLVAVPVEENGEPLVALGPGFTGRVLKPSAVAAPGGAAAMETVLEVQRRYTGDDIFVRRQVAALLQRAQEAVREILPGCDIEIGFGYRHPEVQELGYARVSADLLARDPTLSGDALKEAVHRYVAVPEVAGHPTGGAVDVRIKTPSGAAVPMGTEMGDFVKDTYVFSPFIGKAEWHNRQILRAAMIGAGFAPFDGEWWHFSYGDREWAKYYNRPAALYTQRRFSV